MKKPDKKNIVDVLVLTPMQEGMLFHYRQEPASSLYFEQLSLDVSGKIDRQYFEKAWNFVVETNEILRSAFRWEKVAKPLQIIYKEHKLDLRYHDFSNRGSKSNRQALEMLKTGDRKEGFDLTEIPFRVHLCKIAEDRYEIIISNHHILYDGWSNGIILKEFFSAYNNLAAGKSLKKQGKGSFSGYIKWHQRRDKEQAEKYWQDYLSGFETKTGLPFKRYERSRDIVPAKYHLEVKSALRDALDRFIKERKLSLSAIFYSTFGILLQKYNNSEDVIYGTTVSGRQAKVNGIEEMVGLFINTLPLRVSCESSEKIVDLLEKINETIHTREEFEATPLTHIKECSRLDETEALFDVILAIENYPLPRAVMEQKSPLVINSYSVFEMTHYDLTVTITTADKIDINFIYNGALFEPQVMERLSHHFSNILRDIVENPDKKINEIDILTGGEKRRLLFDFNDTHADYPDNKTIYELFAEQAARFPGNTALVMPHSEANRGNSNYTRTLSYYEFDRRVTALANELVERGLKPGALAAVMLERRLEMVTGIYAILKTGAAYLPILPGSPQERTAYILRDSNADILLTTRENALMAESIGSLPVEMVLIDEIEESRSRRIERDAHGELPAYILYTSGSTGEPKGVMVEHRQVVNILFALQEEYPFGQSDTYLLKTPIVFDVSAAELFGWFLGAGRLAILEKNGEKEPRKIIAAIENAAITHINFVPSMFNLFVDELGSHNIERLAGLKYIFVAGEVIQPHFVKKFDSLNTKIVLENIYGPTEGTVYSSKYHISNWDGRGSIPIGAPMRNIKLHILDKDNNIQPLDIPGELCISGAGLARGYLNNPELTAEKFTSGGQGALFEKTPLRGGAFRVLCPVWGYSIMFPDVWVGLRGRPRRGPCTPTTKAFEKSYAGHSLPLTTHHSPIDHRLYRTGDLASRRPDGNIEFIGRIDRQVKIRGFRIELGEIESRLMQHEAIEKAAVIIKESGNETGEKYIVAYITAEGKIPSSSELREYLSNTLPDYMLPSYFIFIEKIPMTPAGKIDRKALPEPVIKPCEEYTAPTNETEKRLAKIWAELLNIETPLIGVDDNFFRLGGHSLKAARLLARVHRDFDARVNLTQFFKNPTIRWLATHVTQADEEKFSSIKAAEKREYYPLSPAQKRFFVFQQLNPHSISYNIYEAMAMEGHLTAEKFESTFKKIIERHESFRTSFLIAAGEPVQKVLDHTEIEFTLPIYTLTQIKEATLPEDREREDVLTPTDPRAELHAGSVRLRTVSRIPGRFIHPFDLSHAPLIRVGIVRLEEEKHIFLVDMHHIISDGASIGILIRDFLALYKENELTPQRIMYRDYTQWLQNRRANEKQDTKTQEKEYIQENMAGDFLELPTDYIRPQVQSYEGTTIRFEIDKEQTEALRELSLKEGSTLFMVLFAVFNVFLTRLTGQEDIVAGSPIAGRLHHDLADIIGLFINTLVVRNYPAPGKKFTGFLKEVKENSLQAFENQEYQYEELVKKIETARDASRNPLFDVMFVLQNMEMPGIEIPGLKITRDMQENLASKFDMTLYCEDREDYLRFSLEYCTKLFKQQTIKRYIKYFKKILASVIENPGQEISGIEILSPAEKQEILYDFNDTAVDFPSGKTIHRLFEDQAARTPHRIAIQGVKPFYLQGAASPRGTEKGAQNGSGLTNLKTDSSFPDFSGCIPKGDCCDLTYCELNERANRLARVLRSAGVESNRVVGIMLERSAALIEVIYAVLKAGGVYLPIDPQYPEGRVHSMLEDSKATLLVTDNDITGGKSLEEIKQQKLLLEQLAGLTYAQAGENLQSTSKPEDLFYIIFTSGSTGTPKGAAVYQRSFVNLVNWFVEDFELNETDNNLLMTSFSFDLTQKNLYAAPLRGGTLCIPAVNYFDPPQVIREIEQRKITWINCTPSMFSQLIEFCREDELKKLETLRYVFLGGEPLSMNKFMKWIESGYCHGEIVNTYGPTECTDISNAYRIKDPHRFVNEVTPIGKPVYNVRLYVVDKNRHLLPVGIPGELWIAGEGVGSGYVNDRESTAQKFIEHTFVPGEAKQRMYRTGDLVKWRPDRNIEFIGRMDYQVKIRGFRIETGEVEKRLLEHEKIKEAVVIDRKDSSGEKYLCAYFTIGDKEQGKSPGTDGRERGPVIQGSAGVSPTDLRKFLSHTLPDYMIPPYFVELEKIPLNPNGKVDRKALPVPEIVSEKVYAAPRNEIEDRLVHTWSKVLELDPGRIGIDDNFFSLGGHSLRATDLIARIHRDLNVEIKLGDIFRIVTIRGLAEYIVRQKKTKYTSLEPQEEKEYYPLSAPQERMYLLQQLNPGTTAYNIPVEIALEEKIAKRKLEEIFNILISRHESLRTSFHIIDETTVQRIHKKIEFRIEDEKAAFSRPYDLSKAPLARVNSLAQPKERVRLFIEMHHIISDGISMDTLAEEFKALCAGEELPTLKYRYKDYSEWQMSAGRQEKLKSQERYWLKEFSSACPRLDMPADYPRPQVKSYAGGKLDFILSKAEASFAARIARDTGVTLYMVFLSFYYILLHRLSGQEDIVVGIPTAGRTHTDFARIIGMFVNTLAVRNYPSGKKSYRDFLDEVKRTAIVADENQEYQFEELVDSLSIERDVARNPLFDVMFNFLNRRDNREESVEEFAAAEYLQREEVSRFDLTLTIFDYEDRLNAVFQYSTRLFKAETIARFVTYYRNIIQEVSGDIDKRIADIEMISPEEQYRLLYEFNETQADFTQDKIICRLLTDQLERTPDKTAIVCEDGSLSYRQLHNSADRLAGLLRRKGVKPETVVGIMADRSPETLKGIIGVLKAGGAYLPIEPAYPENRKHYILKDSSAALLLTAGDLCDENEKSENRHPGPIATPANLAYIIYTSGSTGTPKGVPVEHRSLLNHIEGFKRSYRLEDCRNYILLSSLCFDASLKQFFIPLTAGECVHVFPEAAEMERLSRYIRARKIDVLNGTPSMFTALASGEEEENTGVKYVFIGGEKLARSVVEQVEQRFPSARVINLYGPTEATVNALHYEIERGGGTEPLLGGAAPNYKVYILSKYNRLLPQGVAGELCISGVGLARGYLNNPELAAEKFVFNDRSYKSYMPYFLEKIYKTGDLARRLPAGEIEYLGRLDQQVKIRGYRIEPGEIENKLLQHSQIKEAVVIDRQNELAETYLCAYYTTASGAIDLPALREFLSTELPPNMIPAYFAALDKIPRTPQGKLDRKALPAPQLLQGEGYAAPRSETERKLVETWAEVLQIESTIISIDQNFFELGGHSLKATILVSKIHKEFNVKIPLIEFFKKPTITAISRYIAAAAKVEYEAAVPQEKKEYYPLSAAQKRMYILQQMDTTGIVYNIPQQIALEKNISKDRLADIFKELIRRHEGLRTFFAVINEEPMQRICSSEGIEFTLESFPRHFVHSFDLGKAPLFRAGLCREETGDMLAIDIHHIISDGISLQVLANEFKALCSGEILEDQRLQYKDYAIWQGGYRKMLKHQERYWLEQFTGELPVLELPADYVRPQVQDFTGRSVSFSLDEEESRIIKQIAQKSGATIYMVILSFYVVLLSKLSGAEDIVVGVPTAGRSHNDFERMIGMFVNTLAVRSYPNGEKSFRDFLQQVKQTTAAAFENQEYQFEDLVERIQAARDTGRSPVFDVVLNMPDQAGRTPYDFQEAEAAGYVHKEVTAKFDLVLTLHGYEDRLYFSFEYGSALFKPETIERFIGYFRKLVLEAGEDITKKIAEMEMILPEERDRLLYDFNDDTRVEYGEDRTLHELFAGRMERIPDRTALVFEDSVLSYGQLVSSAQRLARYLRGEGVQADEIVGIMVERSPWMITGILGILQSGGAYLPINPENPAVRVKYMLADSGAKLLLTTRGCYKEGKVLISPGIETAFIDELGVFKSSADQEVEGKGCDGLSHLAYIIYTSGSTGNPKGVPITHGNISPLLNWGYKCLDLKESDRVVQNLSYFFDWSVWEIFITLTTGASLVMVSDETLLNPNEYIRFMERHRISVLHITPTHFQYLVNEGQRLETLKHLVIGAEKLSYELMVSSLGMVNEDCRVYNMYGPTEATIISAVLKIDREVYRTYRNLSSVPIGQPAANLDLYVLDRNCKLCPINIAGELYILGEGTARGYLNNPELTTEKFIFNNRSYKSHRSNFFKKMYKTGDLARWSENGAIEYMGRIDQQVKIRGFRIEPGEIESCLRGIAGIREAVVIEREGVNKERYLCAYVVVDESSKPGLEISGDKAFGINAAKIKDILSRNLPGYMIPQYFVQVERIPLNSNGKIDKRMLPEPELSEKKYIGPGSEVERKLVETWAEILTIEPGKISIDADFFELGGHSLKATILVSRIHKEFDVKIPLIEFFKKPTITAISRYIAAAAKVEYEAAVPQEKKEYYPLSAAQKRMYILQQMDTTGIVYNIPQQIALEKNISKDRLADIFKELIRRHEGLRTFFAVINEEPMQRICSSEEIEFKLESFPRHFGGPFDLGKAPLFRAGLCREETGDMLAIDMHHIISDGISLQVLANEFKALCSGEILEDQRLQYKDYAIWQGGYRKMLKHQERYWLEQFTGELPVLELPADYARPQVQDFTGRSVSFSLDEEESRIIKKIAQESGATIYMVILSFYAILLSKLSGAEDIVVGVPTAGRSHNDFERMTGMFVNTLAVRSYPNGEKSYKDFLQQVKQTTAAAFENQEYQFEDLVERIQAARDTGRSPVFDVVLNMPDQAGRTPYDFQEAEAAGYVHKEVTAKFDLVLTLHGYEDRLYFSFEYGSALFKPETIERFIGYFRKLVLEAGEDITKKIAEMEMILAEERNRLLYDFNDGSKIEYPEDRTLQGLFADRVERHPDRTALVFEDSVLSYGQLGSSARRLARYLCEEGVGVEKIVGIRVERSPWMIMGILGILQSGGAYLPINPASPAIRTKYMLADSGAKLLLTTRACYKEGEELDSAGIKTVFIDELDVFKNFADREVEERGFDGLDHLAYIIYTSGSTGNPKGVPITHGNISPLLNWGYKCLDLKKSDRVVQNLSYFFDWSVWEIFITLTAGASLVMVAEEKLLNPNEYIYFMKKHHITVMHITPTHFQYLVNEGQRLDTLKHLVIGAEKLSYELTESSLALVNEDCRVYNMYGPTEATIISAVLEIDREVYRSYRDLTSVPIGQPAANLDLFILDKYLRLCAFNIPGELYISGEGTARGYLNNPELTTEKFIFNNMSYKSYRSNFFKKMYKTGDLARWLENGTIEYMGRIDQQVKIRGFRIEPGEIESCLRSIAGIKEAVVIEREGVSKEKYLCAYVVIDEGLRRDLEIGGDKAFEIDAAKIKDILSRNLPGYMIPQYFVQVERIPLNSNGKIDKKMLPEPELSEKKYIGPGSEVERKLVEIWAEILTIEPGKISIDADFFELGGHSLKATILISRIQHAMNVELMLVEIFKYSTIREIAKLINALNFRKRVSVKIGASEKKVERIVI